MLHSFEVTLAVCVKYKTILSTNMANHHHIKDSIPFLWTSGRGSILWVFGKHDPSISIHLLWQIQIKFKFLLHQLH